MNAHDSEKVVGTLLSEGYSQVPTPEEAELVFYNTCSIRDKAEQKVFHRLDQFKAQFKKSEGNGKKFAVLGCVAQQEGEKIFEKAPHVSMVCGSASYNQLPQMLVQLEAGNRRVTGLSLDTRTDVRNAAHAPRQSASRLHHDHRRLRQILRLLRGAFHARAGAQPHERIGDRRSPRARPDRPHRNSAARPKREQLSRSFRARVGFRKASRRGGPRPRDPPRALYHFASARFREAHRGRHRHESGVVQSRASAGAVRIDAHPRSHAAALHARGIPAEDCLDEGRAAGPSRSPPTSSSASRARPKRTSKRHSVCSKRSATIRSSVSSIRAGPNTAALALADQIPEEEKTRRLAIVQERQRAIQVAERRLRRQRGRVHGGGIQQGHRAVDGADLAAQDAEFSACRRGRLERPVRASPRDACRAQFVGRRMCTVKSEGSARWKSK